MPSRLDIKYMVLPVALFLILISLNYSMYFKEKPEVKIWNMEVSTKPSETMSSISKEKQPKIMSSTMQEKMYGIMKTKPIQFLPNFKNPCWYGSSNNGPISDNKLHCLPFFYIIGVKKSGTTDLFARISAHPEFESAGFKEAHWFTRRRFHMMVGRIPKETANVLKGKDPFGLEYYVSMFDIAARNIAQHPASRQTNTTYYTHITAEASSANLNINWNWENLPGNEGLVEPRYTTLHYIKHIVPDVKILVIFRDPVDRLYSDYHFVTKGYPLTKVSPQMFHARVQFEVETYTKCFQQYSVRRCIYNNTLFDYSAPEIKPALLAFNASFYSVHMKELLNVFTKDQLLPILMLDYIQDKNATLANVFHFLGLSKLDSKTMNSILTKKISNENSERKKKVGPMLEKTKQLLRTFLKPFNEDMAELMNDSRYLFNPNSV